MMNAIVSSDTSYMSLGHEFNLYSEVFTRNRDWQFIEHFPNDKYILDSSGAS